MLEKKVEKKVAKKQRSWDPHVLARLTDGGLVFLLFFSLFMLLSLASFQRTDGHIVQNAAGWVGGYLAYGLVNLLGVVAYTLPFILVISVWFGLKAYQRKEQPKPSVIVTRTIGCMILLAALCALATFDSQLTQWVPSTAGGLVGFYLAYGLYSAFNLMGAHLFLVAMMGVGFSLMFEMQWLARVEWLGRQCLVVLALTERYVRQSVRYLRTGLYRAVRLPYQFIKAKRTARAMKVNVTRPPKNITKKTIKEAIKPISPQPITAPKSDVTVSERFQKESQVPLFDMPSDRSLPALSLLDKPHKSSGQGLSNKELEAMSREVEQCLLDFGVDVKVVAVHPGPVITRYELQLAPGVKVNKISSLAKDLARSLSVISVRVVEVIPGKSVIGIELPNAHREMVTLGEVLSTKAYDESRSPLSLALGVDISGHPSIVNLAKMPHLLVAGTTGSGKSVGINAMILSLLFKATPAEVRLILVDPKMLELSVYEGIPHLLTPVVTDMKDAANALRWSVGEMERRYRLMAALGVRNLAGFNKKVNDAALKGEPIRCPLWTPSVSMDEQAPELQSLPSIVIVIDELADMMMVVGKKVEQLIARIAQKARAAGIHLILATQRPSVDVLTGLIKSNIPTRISFQVSSKIDSRTILDQQGADQLLGHGDMLYLAPGEGAPIRVHGAFVDDAEVHRVATEWRRRGSPSYIDEIVSGGSSDLSDMGIDGEDTEDADELYDEVVEFVTKTRKASISSVQRRFKIGYNRSARLIEELERTGVIGPMEGSSGREVLAPAPREDG